MKRLLLYLTFVGIGIAGAVLLFQGYQKHRLHKQGIGHAIGETLGNISAIHRALAGFRDYHEKGFEDLTARRLTLLNSNIFAFYPPLLEILTNFNSVVISAEKDFLDVWGQPYRMKFEAVTDDPKNGNKQERRAVRVTVWSCGRNRKDDGGKRDDLVESRELELGNSSGERSQKGITH